MGILNAHELRSQTGSIQINDEVNRNKIILILDNVLDTYNVGAIFRLADACAVEEVLLTGHTLTPPNSRIKKASINTTEWVPWRYFPSAVEAISQLKMEQPSLQVIAVEQHKTSVAYHHFVYPQPVALVVGNESTGVSEETLTVVDRIVELPMWGVNKSLNVMVSCGIVLFEILKQYHP